MNIKKIFGNFSVALISQLVALAGNVVTTLVVPKMMGVAEFGYWQLFMFYIGYVCFFNLGLNDGVYLHSGGLSREGLDKKSINSQFVVGIAYQSLFAVVIIVASVLVGVNGKRLFVILMTGAYLLITNCASFIGYLLQAIDETRRYSFYCAINGFLFFVPLVALLLFRVSHFELYVVFYTFAHFLSFLLCLWWVRDFLPYGIKPLVLAIKDTRRSICSGIKVMFASIAGMVILGASRFVADMMWDIQTFGMVSFALSMTSFFLIFAQQASMVLFPALRKAGVGETVRFFKFSRDLLDVLLPVIYVLFFPAIFFIDRWLPEYQSSFIYFAFLLPVAVYNGKQSVIGNTYLLVLRQEGILFKVNIIAALISVLGALIGEFIFHSLLVMIIFADIAIVWRFVYVERLLERELSVSANNMRVISIVLGIIFLFCYSVLPRIEAFILTLVLYILFLLLSRKLIAQIVSFRQKNSLFSQE